MGQKTEKSNFQKKTLQRKREFNEQKKKKNKVTQRKEI